MKALARTLTPLKEGLSARIFSPAQKVRAASDPALRAASQEHDSPGPRAADAQVWYFGRSAPPGSSACKIDGRLHLEGGGRTAGVGRDRLLVRAHRGVR